MLGLVTMAGNGSAAVQTGCAIHVYAANRSMHDRFFYDADGELLIVPQLGRLRIATELGIVEVEPQEIAVIPRGLRFRVELVDGQARGYVAENFGAALHLPELGPAEHALRLRRVRCRDHDIVALPQHFRQIVHGLECFHLRGLVHGLRVHREAHELGLRSNATMLYGHIEEAEHRIDHLIRLRELQDQTGGFQTFIPLAFHPDNTRLSHIPKASGMTDLKVMAVSRLMLDNFPHVKAYWVMLGIQTAQVAQCYGADDLDGTVVHEKIYHEAGAHA